MGTFFKPQVMFPATTLVILIFIWGSTQQLIDIEHTNAQRAASVLSSDLADIYETQALRALREIDQTLKFVKYAYEHDGNASALADLKAKDILPPASVFIVSITNSAGTVIASTHPKSATALSSDNFFQQPIDSNAVVVNPPHRDLNGEWALEFSRHLQTAGGTFAGIVWITVRADYFVSGYDKEKLGEHGMVGLLGNDGIFRVRRSGDTVTADDPSTHYAAMSSATSQNAIKATQSKWDNVRRYTSVRPLFGYPLTAVVGVAEAEQFAITQKQIDFYVKKSITASIVVTVMMALLWQFVRVRRQAINERLTHAERVEYLAYHDGLTGLPNRRLLSKIQHQAIAQARRYNHTASLLFLDLDGFKQVNDTLGHEAGDRLLQEVAQRLRNCLRKSDTVARLGGDEFVVLLPETDGQSYIAAVAQKILAAIATPYTELGLDFQVTASIGISVFPMDGLDEQTLARHADVAMYRAKEQGKNNAQFYSLEANSLAWRAKSTPSTLP